MPGFTTDYDNIIASLSGAIGEPGAQLYGDTDISGFYSNQNLYTSSVPEPSTYAMMAMGFAGLGFAGLRKARAKLAFA
jgi:hypothetical protein